MPRWQLWLLWLVLAAASATAQAHDTWFQAVAASNPGELRLALGTGNRFPVQEVSVGRASLVASGCRGAGSTGGANGSSRDSRPLEVLGENAQALLLRTSGPATPGLSCWAQQAPQDITLPPHKVKLYLDEIRAPAALRQRWATLTARGLPWVERYTKHARLEWDATAPAAAPLDMDIVLAGPPPGVGDALAFTVLRRGQPLPLFAVELVNAASGLGFWLRTDAAGRAQVTLPLAGSWLLRGTDLRADPRRPDAWESGFVTLAFDVAAPAP